MNNLLKKLKSKNITIDLNDGQLAIQAPKGAITSELLSEIESKKDALVTFITEFKSEDLDSRIQLIPKASTRLSYVLSSSQYRLWLLDQVESGNRAYSMPSLFSLKGNISIIDLEEAFFKLIERHEILRTNIDVEKEKGIPKQYIKSFDANTFQLKCVDVSKCKDVSKTLQRIVEKEVGYNFNLASDSLLRACLIKKTEGNYVLVVVMHHIISDGWSSSVMISDLFSLYQSIIKGEDSILAPLSIQYKDFAEWQQSTLSSAVINEDKEYWLRQFKGEIPTLDIPTYKLRPFIKTYNGKTIEKQFDKNLIQSFKKVCKDQGATFFMGLLSVVKILFYKYTNQTDIVIGSPFAGREHVELQNQIGFYVNTVGIRSSFKKEDTFITFLNQVKSRTLDAHTHQNFPFDDLIKNLDIKIDRSRNPLFDVVLKVDTQEGILDKFNRDQNLVIEEITLDDTTSKFDLEFSFKEDNNGSNLFLSYNTDIYTEDFTTQITDHLEVILKSIIENPKLTIGSVPYLTVKEKTVLLEKFNDTKVDYPLDKTAVDLFEEQVTKTPNNIALVFNEKAFTYQELNEQANQLGDYLRSNYKIQADDLVAIKLDRSEWMIISILGVLKSGGAYVPIDISYPQERINYIETDSKCKVVIDEKRLGIFRASEEKYSIKNLQKITNSNHLAYVIYTSGSTGKPKGVMIEHSSFLNTIHSQIDEFEISKKSKGLQFASFSFDASVWEIFLMLLSGGELHLLENEIKLNSQKLLNYINQNYINFATLSPSLLSTIDNKMLSNIKTLVTAGEQANIKHFKELRNIINAYGPTEISICATTFSSADYLNYTYRNNPPIGTPIANTQIYILNTEELLCPLGVVGEICIGGAGLARGYLNRPELTAEKFVHNPFKAGEKIYKTGDLGRWLADGNIEFIGRKDDQVKVRGYRIELGEIESSLLEHPAIEQAVVLVKEDTNLEKQLVAYLTSQEELTTSDLRSYLKKKIPDYMLPMHFVQLEIFPLTPNGKIDKKVLPSPEGLGLTTGVAYVAPSNKIEKELVKIWSEVLKVEVEKIGIKDDFFNLGGHSLRATALASKIYQRLEVYVPIRNLFENTSIEAQALFISKEEKTTYHQIEKVATQDSYALSSAQRRLWILSQFEGGNLAYNLPGVFELEGGLDIPSFQKAFATLIERHEILRTVFKKDESGAIRQWVKTAEDQGFYIDYQDLRKIKNQKSRIKELIKIETEKVFDLEQGPLLRAQLLQITKNKYTFTYVMHHIISDGWSMGVLIKELLTLYNSYSQRKPNPLEALALQYKDYSAWQLSQLEDGNNQQHKDYWLNQLSGELPILGLPTDHLRPALKTYNGNSISGVFSEPISSQLKQVIKEENGTAFMGLLSLIKILLYRYTGQGDIIVGSPIAGREHADLVEQIGFYVNTLALRTQFGGEDSFRELLQKVKETTLSAYEHQIYPFDELVDRLDLSRDLSRSPLFDVMVILQNNVVTFDDEHLGELQISSYEESESLISKFDLTFNFVETDQGLYYSIIYNTDLFERATIERLENHLKELTESIVASPEKSINKLDYLSKKEVQQLLVDFNDTKAAYPKDKTIIDLFEQQVERIPDNIAVVFEDKQLTYRDLNKKVNELCSYLVQQSIPENSLIGICMSRSEKMLISMLSVLKLGSAYVPLDPKYPISRINYIVEDAKIETIITELGIQSFIHFEGVQTLVCLDEIEMDEFIPEKENLNNPISLSKPAYVIYTSGSTGNPKGVEVSHGNLSNFIIGMNNCIETDVQSNWLSTTSISFDISILELFWPLTIGNKIVIKQENPIAEQHVGNMDFSLFYFAATEASKGTNKYELLLEGAKFADSNGLKGLWVPERHFHSFGDQFPNPSIAASAVSAITNNIKIRSGSIVLPLHNPIRVAEDWSMVDNLSNGRVELSIASGWHPNDFVFYPENYADRFNIMIQNLAEVKSLWRGNSIVKKNGLGENFEFKIHPKPIQEELPTWITAAGSPKTFEYAGSIGANILTHLLGQDKDELAEKIKIYRESLADNGFDPNKGKVALMLHTFITNSESKTKEIVTEPFRNYLRHSIGLMAMLAKSMNLNLDENLEQIIDIGFDRYYNSASLFGTVDSCYSKVQDYVKIGVNEIACLVDFGIDNKVTLAELNNLVQLQEKIKLAFNKNNYFSKITARSNSFSELIEAEKITHFQATPSYFSTLLEHPEDAKSLTNLTSILVGGEKFPEQLHTNLKRYGCNLYNMYGPTETTIWSSVKKIDSTDSKITIGKPISNTHIYILDKNENIIPIGVVGEIYISGDGLANGYLNRPELTAEKFVPNPYQAGGRMYKTGDLGKWLPDGNIEFIGRKDAQVKIRGHRIELGEIETILSDHESVQECVVLAKTNDLGEDQLVAYLRSEAALNTVVLRTYLKGNLPDYMLPNYFVQLEVFPLTPNGKIDKKRLSNSSDSGLNIGVEYVEPSTDIEKQLVKIWSKILNIESDKIGVHADFFDLGGSSLSVFRVISEISKELSLKLSFNEIFNKTTIEELAELIERKYIVNINKSDFNNDDDSEEFKFKL